MSYSRSLGVLIFMAACGGDASSGSYAVTWQILNDGGAASSCEAEQLAEVRVEVLGAGDEVLERVTAPCAAGGITTEEVEGASHTIRAVALGLAGEEAGTARVDAEVTGADPAPAALQIRAVPFTNEIRVSWRILRSGAPSDCDAVGADYVAISAWNDGQQRGSSGDSSCRDTLVLWQMEPAPTPYEFSMTLRRNGGEVLARSTSLTLSPPFRGQLEHEFVLNVQ